MCNMKERLIISKPEAGEYPEWFAAEIEEVHYNDLLDGLTDSMHAATIFLQQLSEEQLQYRYAPGKWSIKQIWQHVIDVERVLSYRALRYARNDETILHGFDENRYAENCKSDARDFVDILREYGAVRMATIELFRSFTPAMFFHRGAAGQSNMTVRALGYLILGHELHHIRTIKTRYV